MGINDIRDEALTILNDVGIDEDDMIEKDFAFFSDMKKKAQTYKDNFRVSFAQLKWLRDIKEKYTFK